MSIRPVDFVTVQRMQDAAQIKQNEIAKPLVDQKNFETIMQKDIQRRSEQVVKKDDIEKQHEKHDAKEKSKNEYYEETGAKDDNAKKSGKERVVVKGRKGFDIKI